VGSADIRTVTRPLTLTCPSSERRFKKIPEPPITNRGQVDLTRGPVEKRGDTVDQLGDGRAEWGQVRGDRSECSHLTCPQRAAAVDRQGADRGTGQMRGGTVDRQGTGQIARCGDNLRQTVSE
jgi:hypothetical protein